MKKQPAKLIPLITTGLGPAATFTSALVSPLALAATGDLDPGFGDLGRLGPILNGPAWSLQPDDGGSTLLGGGGLRLNYYYYYYYSFDITNFVNRVTDTGLVDPGFLKPPIDNVQVFDIARQADGQVVAVGRRVAPFDASTSLVAFRLQADGALDTTFGTDGIVEVDALGNGTSHMGRSVVLDPDGRIVIAGSRAQTLFVLRLLPDGSLDDSFATAGIFEGPNAFDFSSDGSGARTHILRTGTGAYRVTASNAAGCQVVALTADGALEETFGTSGIANVDAPSGTSTYCNAMASQADGRLLLAGSAAGRGFAARLLEDGQADPGFVAGSVPAAMEDATAIAAAPGGAVAVAGTGVSGASIMRLQASGELDVLFGSAGSTLIDLRSDTGTDTLVHDMLVRDDGSVLAAGGEHRANKAFVVRLLGTGGGASPGVLGLSAQEPVSTAEGAAEVVVRVRRSGGSSGSVSVAYGTAEADFRKATAGLDYTAVTGTLAWNDGDVSEQEIRVPILADGATEAPERFVITLSAPGGGAGLGTTSADIEIAADGGPFGQLRFLESRYTTLESRSVTVEVVRDYYASGAVSVTLTPVSGTAAAGSDFTASPVTLTWADGDLEPKLALIPIIDDSLEEASESFTVELSNPTGGAVLGSLPTTTVVILTSDQPTQRRDSGGGVLGFLSLLFLGLTGLLRLGRSALRSRSRLAR
ncbi:MAG: hypothetical protein OEW35_06445 [Gammaproteobacteria bacterium]|nr:hypothetical protein [Gammaproteobacteria bacterium]